MKQKKQTTVLNKVRKNIFLWLEKNQEKEKIRTIKNAKENIIYLLTDKKSVEESLEIFENISETFHTLMKKKLKNNEQEKTKIIKFLKISNND